MSLWIHLETLRALRVPRSLALPMLLIGCSHAGTAEPSKAPSTEESLRKNANADAPPTTETETSAAAAPAEEASAQTPAEEVPERLVFDLAGHLERAELTFAGEPFLQLSLPGGRKYDAGGWLSGTDAIKRVDGEMALIATGSRARLWLPADGPTARTLELRVRSARETPLTVYVNDKTVADAKLSGKAFETIQVEVPDGLLHAGDNELLLRAHRSGAMPGAGSAALALSYVRTSKGETQALPLDAAPLTRSQDEAQHLLIGPDYGTGFSLEVPEDARLRAQLAAGQGGTLEVTATVDGRPTTQLLELRQSDAEQAVDVDLSGLKGQLARITLAAKGGPVQLAAPRIVTLAGASEDVPEQATEPAKNVLVVLIDTLRADKLKPYNERSRVETPGLHMFLRDAAVMRNARTQENWTKPSVATLLSSLFPWEHNAVTGEARVPRSVELMPELLQDRGYHTAAFIANGYVSDKFGFKQGLDFYRNYIREGRKTKAQFVAADVLDFLDRRPKDKPFFIYMHTIDPHVPYRPPESFLERYDDEPYGGPVDFRKSSTLLEKVKMGSLKLNQRDKRHLEALYDAEISYHDVHFAAVLRGLEERGLDKNTVVVVTADHGEEFWDHGSVGHGHSVYDELLHIPMIVRVPGVTHGAQRLDNAVGLVDVMPTVLDAIGQEKPKHLSGTSFLPQLQGQSLSAPSVAVSGFMRGWRTAASGGLKLIQRNLNHTFLYDTDKDPGETEDLVASRPLAVRHMRGLLGLELSGARSSHHEGKRATYRRENVTIDKATKAQLEALGYVGGQP